MLARVSLTVTFVALLGCGDAGKAEPQVSTTSDTPGAAPTTQVAPQQQETVRPAQRIEPVAVEASALPAAAEHRGHVVAARRWTDRLGENLLILTETDAFDHKPCEWDYCGNDKELYAYHYVQRDSGLALLWRTTDFIRECDVDMTVQMGAHTLAITDLDADGVAESTFLYILACRGDVSAAAMKLMMHEGAEKYAIRGTTDEDPRIPGADRSEMNVDAAFNRAPPAFRTFAVAHWKKFTNELEWRELER